MHPRVRTIAVLVALACNLPALAQAQVDQAQSNRGLGHLARLAQETKDLGDWDENYPMVERMVDRFWTENDLTDESDLFARDLVKKVAAIPPWEIARRMEVMTDSVSQRYNFSARQRAQFQSGFLYHMGKTIFKNGPVMFKQMHEITSARANGQPFTPEQVAEWTRETEPMMADFRQEFEQFAAGLSKSLTPEQKRILERDMDSFHRRQQAFNKLREKWADGDWTPQEWGMDEDPIQMQRLSSEELAEMVRNKKRAIAVRRASPRVINYDESTWERYVRQFIQRYELDNSQANAALSILREMQQRARAFRRTHPEAYRDVPRTARYLSPQFKPLRDMFDELKQRLDRIPTDAQRHKVETSGKTGR